MAICSGASNSSRPFSSSCFNGSLEFLLEGFNLVFEVCACIKLVVVIVMIFMFIEVDNIVMLFFRLSEEEFVVSMAESTEAMMCCLLSALGEGILELIDLCLDIVSELSEFSLTSFSFRVEVEKSSIL